MRRTESLDHLNHKQHQEQSKKRSNRSKSKPKSARKSHHHAGRSPSIVRLLTYDPSFEEFDTAKYEGEVNYYRKAKVTNLKSIVAGTYNKTSRITTTTEDEKDKPSTNNESLLQILKAPTVPTSVSTSPFEREELDHNRHSGIGDNGDNFHDDDDDDDNDYDVSEVETVLHIPIKKDGHVPSPPKNDRLVSGSSHFEKNNTTPSNLWGSSSTNFDPPHPTSSTESIKFSLDELDEWETIFTKTYKEEQTSIEKSHVEPWRKLEQLYNLYRSWVLDLYEQLDKFYDTFEEFQSATEFDRREFSQEIHNLQTQLYNSQLEICHERGKVEMIEKDNHRHVKIIEKLKATVSNLKLAEAEKLQHLEKVQNDEVKAEQIALEQCRAKVFLKERHIQKLNIEEQAMKCRIRASQREESHLQSQLTKLRAVVMTMENRVRDVRRAEDKELDECWRNLSSGAD
ncbi:uncharacterized protein LOC118435392 [Folsomia candida]|uniref:uncharacterized protein LOC118435392 n=1 Tax=Folsomia candida TaxID=158441 RepID=UPI001604C7AE|nr:uncharacterized protein LOC118435392 [Folsomia candida]